MNLKGAGNINLVWSMMTIIHNKDNNTDHFNTIFDMLNKMYGTDGLYQEPLETRCITLHKIIDHDTYGFLYEQLKLAERAYKCREESIIKERIQRNTENLALSL